MKWFLRISIFVVMIVGVAYVCTNMLLDKYHNLSSEVIFDRHGTPIYVEQNAYKQYFLPHQTYPERLKEIVLKKEDQYFYYHPGVNPFSLLRTVISGFTSQEYGGSSTVTQQLVKILLENTSDRTILNKIKESLLAVALEIRLPKEEILTMYLNTVNLGNQVQGFAQASLLYYGKPIDELAEIDFVTLAATLSSPSVANPWEEANTTITKDLAEKANITNTVTSPRTTSYNFNTPTAFEVKTILSNNCKPICHTTVDASLSEQIRLLAKNHTDTTSQNGGTEVAVVVVAVPNNEVLAIVGSPNPTSQEAGAQINMAVAPRPIGSTIKPFIYAHAFEADARPYSLIRDQEYKYEIGTGFSLYPKNFDGSYQGIVTLETALANSLNTPSVKLLEYITLPRFYKHLTDDMQFKAINPLSSYAYGIALGGLEMDLLTLTHYFTALAQAGVLHPLSITPGESMSVPQNTITKPIQLFTPPTIELVNSILTNRQAGADQFSIKSTLDVFNRTVAVKTGTSRDFHDSWTIGYTPDYVVGVWLGNAQNESMKNLSGSTGAGTLWRQIMELLETSPYNHHSTFTFEHIAPHTIDDSIMYGLSGDDLALHTNVLLEDTLILSPHDGDTILYTKDASLSLISDTSANWIVDGIGVGRGSHIFWEPKKPGTHTITANAGTDQESIVIEIVDTAMVPLP